MPRGKMKVKSIEKERVGAYVDRDVVTEYQLLIETTKNLKQKTGIRVSMSSLVEAAMREYLQNHAEEFETATTEYSMKRLRFMQRVENFENRQLNAGFMSGSERALRAEEYARKAREAKKEGG